MPIINFHWQDLNEDDVMVLDSGDEVYVWIGKGADDQEKEKAFAMAEVTDRLRKSSLRRKE